MGASISEEEKRIMDLPYAIQVGTDNSSKQCNVFRNFAAVDAGHLIDRDDETVHSLY